MDGDEGPPLKLPDEVAPSGDGVQQQDREDGSQPPPVLPDDVLANIVGRIAPCWVAASRCVCRSWCACIDARRLLRADLLPLSLCGIFVQFNMHKFPAFFSRPIPPGAPAFSGKLSFLHSADPEGSVCLPDEDYYSRERYAIKDHCNGLLLIDNYVVNPVTRHWDVLPPGPPGRVQFTICTDQDHDPTPFYENIHSYLVFDPTVSAHYQVLRICDLSRMGSRDELKKKDSAECPSSSFAFNVLSSRTGSWEQRCFVREGEAAGTFAEVRDQPHSGAVYWRGALYVHCESHFLLRVSLSSNTYHVIKPPPCYGANCYPVPCLQRSEMGVYFVSLDRYWLRVWILKESCGQTEWALKHDRDLEPMLAHQRLPQAHGPWMLKGINHNSFCTNFPEENNKEDSVEEKFEWSSDSDTVLENEDNVQERSSEECYSNNGGDGALDYEGTVQDRSSEQCYSINDDNGDVLDNEDQIEKYSSEDNKKAIAEEKFESEECYWTEDTCEIHMLGLHPYKEVLFLCESAKTGLAYHLNSSIERLGDIYPRDYVKYDGYGYDRDEMDRLRYAFPYTPCWTEEFPKNN